MNVSARSALLALIICSGCGTAPVRQVPAADRTRTYEAPRAKVYGACLLALSDLGLAIQTADATSGVILSDWIPIPFNYGEFSCPARTRYNVIVLEDAGKCRVSLAAFYERQTGGYLQWTPQGVSPEDASENFARVFGAIEAALSR